MEQYNIILNTDRAEPIKTNIELCKGDKGQILNLIVNDFNTAGTTAKIIFKKSDGNVVEATITAVGNTYSYIIRGTELEKEGLVVADVKFYASNKRISSACFLFWVQSDTINDTLMESGSYSDTLGKINEFVDGKLAEMGSQIVDLNKTISLIEDNEVIRQNYYDDYSLFENYSNSKDYVIANKVTYEGSTYQNLIPCREIAPYADISSPYWKLVAKRGDKGETGAIGINGKQGIQGTQGIQGVDGLQGLKGDRGDRGDKGETGLAGSQGMQGAQGSQGIQGIKGDTGSQGIQGLKGDTGNAGAQGIQGLKGDKGDRGDKGETGLAGSQGVQGSQGPQGIQGLKGGAGSQGVQGIKGSTGSQGIQGIQGLKGDTGLKGDKGDRGADAIATQISGQYIFQIIDGHLFVIYPDGATSPPPFVINPQGHLIATIGG